MTLLEKYNRAIFADCQKSLEKISLDFSKFDFDFVWELGCPECGNLEWNGSEAACFTCSLQAYRDIWR